MHALGVPTTRAAALVVSGTTVVRDPQYDGHPIEEPAAVLTRVAPTFLRFGSFEIAVEQPGVEGPSAGNPTILKHLFDYAATSFFAPLLATSSAGPPSSCLESGSRVFAEVCRRTAHLLAQWQAVGFVHGVMNTDNMSFAWPDHRLRAIRVHVPFRQ